MGRSVEALAAIRRAQALDPLSLIISTAAGRILHFARAYADAIEQYGATLDLDANFPDAHMNLGMTYLEVGRAEEAIDELRRASDLSGRRSVMLSVIGYAYAVSGQESEAQRIIDELKPGAERGDVSAMLLVYPYAGLGESDRAFEWLERSLEERSGLDTNLKVEPMFDRLRGDPRFTTLMRRLRLAY
jgi:serine/threonine-protein kinase